MPKGSIRVQGPDLNKDPSIDNVLRSYKSMGFQATSLGEAMEIVEKMRTWRLSDEPISPDESDEYTDPSIRKETKCTIFLGYTSNLVSSGLREIIRYLVQNKMVDALVTTAGGIEEDFIKCLGHTYLGDFALNGSTLRKNGLNRIGNLLVPNDNYCKFEDWVVPILDEMLEEQKSSDLIWSPSKMIKRLGERIESEESIYYWAAKVGTTLVYLRSLSF